MPQTVTVTKGKRPAGSGSWHAYAPGNDAYGDWLFTPAHSTYRGFDGNAVDYCEVAQESPGGPGRDSVVLMARESWWIATWVCSGVLRCSADIATPPKLIDNAWWFEDLELDLFLTRDGIYGVEDEDEFAAACSAGLIDRAEKLAALRAAEHLRLAFAPSSPLVLAGEVWLRRGVELALTPLPPPEDSVRTGRVS
jgi:Protein of unknown function (DUF402)